MPYLERAVIELSRSTVAVVWRGGNVLLVQGGRDLRLSSSEIAHLVAGYAEQRPPRSAQLPAERDEPRA